MSQSHLKQIQNLRRKFRYTRDVNRKTKSPIVTGLRSKSIQSTLINLHVLFAESNKSQNLIK